MWEDAALRRKKQGAIPFPSKAEEGYFERKYDKNQGFVEENGSHKNIGLKSVLATTLVFLLTVAATGVGGYQLYKSTKESIELRGKVNAVQSAKELDNYLIVRKNTVVLAAHVVDDMITDGKPNSEILDYITAESASIKKAIDKDYMKAWRILSSACCMERRRTWALSRIGKTGSFP